MAKITVTGKADLGWSHKFGQITKGEEYLIDEYDFAPELFDQPGTNNQQNSNTNNEAGKPAKASAKAGGDEQ